ncbi:MAG: DUF4340 domain-containing protein [Acidobacteriota bacterium]|nr:DUF4340 domain-containing protein [Acidobacteriota bacterium]
MSNRSTMILLLLAVLLGAFVLLWEKDQPGTDQRREQAGRIFPGLEAPAIERLRIERAGRDPIEIERHEDAWRLVAPLEDRADRFAVDDLLRSLVEARAARTLQAGRIEGGDAATGLGGEALRLILTDDAGRHVLEIGTKEVPGGRRYARRDDAADLLIVEDGLWRQLDKDAATWRDKELIDLSTVDLQRAVFEGRDLAFERREGRKWWITRPLEDLADPGAVNGLLSAVVGLRAESIAPDEEREAAGLESPRLTVELAGEEQNVVLRLGAATGTKDGTYFATVSDRQALFVVRAASLLEKLDRKVQGWRSSRALDFSPWDVGEFVIERGDLRVRVGRLESSATAENTWIALEPEDFPLDSDKAADLLSDLSLLDAEALVDDSSPPGAPEASLTLRWRRTEEIPDLVFSVGPADEDGRVWARRDDRPTPMLIPAEKAALIDPERLRADP